MHEIGPYMHRIKDTNISIITLTTKDIITIIKMTQNKRIPDNHIIINYPHG
jgi:hypothetical protein